MNKTLKVILLFLSMAFLGYGFFIFEPYKDIDNTNSYVSIGLGVLSLVLSLLKEKEKKTK